MAMFNIIALILIYSTNLQFVHSIYNVLFIVADDLRADIGGYYGNEDIIFTPNINAFQKQGFTFTHGYTQCAQCGPTRASFLTGVRPDTTRVWSIGPYFRDRMVNNTGKTVVTLPQYFKDYGQYYTVGAGKIFHPGSSSGGSGKCNQGDDQPYSWSQTYWDCDQYDDGQVQSPAMNNCTDGHGCTQSTQCLQCLAKWNCYTATKNYQQCVCPADCDDHCFPDADVATQTLKYFADITTNGTKPPDKPFFIAAGLKRPHLGFFAPLRYYQQYGYENNFSNVSIATHRTIPQNAPVKAYNNISEAGNWLDIKAHLHYTTYTNPKEIDGKTYTVRYVEDDFQNHVRGAYYSAVSFMDAQFGRIIEGLTTYNLLNTTVVSFTGDHGWHLGEQGCFSKFTNFEVGVRVPLIIRVPGMNEGQKSDVLVEQLDIYPTLIEASGLGFNTNITKQLEGKSLFKFIQNPKTYEDYYAYSQFQRGGSGPDYNVMGISMRTSQWRYTEWLGWNAGSNTQAPYPIWDKSYGVELYNHSNKTVDDNDMNAYDNVNLAYETDMKDIVSQLHDELYKTWDNQPWSINTVNKQT